MIRPAHTSRRTTRLLVLLSAALVLAGAALLWTQRHELTRTLERAALPEPATYEEAGQAAPRVAFSPAPLQATSTPRGSLAAPAALPPETNLAVPFTPQAPHANWEQPYGDFCEEASVLMAASYIHSDTIASPEDADQKMLAIKAFEDQTFGYSKDTTASETAQILRDFYDIDAVMLKDNPTITDIKQALATGKLVIVPAAGRLLGNPYFQAPGPLYHMFVIKGYTNNGQFIVNDPGTRRGADFLYSEATVMNAMHDWRPDGQIELGRKVIIIVG